MMKNLKPTPILLSLLAWLVFTEARGQTISPQVINTTGNTYNGTFNLSYSVGEISIQTYSASGNTLTEGLLQPEPIVGSGIAEYSTDGNMIVFPNPFTDKITVKSTEAAPVSHVVIYDITGQKIYDNAFTGDAIELGGIAPGMYILFAYRKDAQHASSFKILKN